MKVEAVHSSAVHGIGKESAGVIRLIASVTNHKFPSGPSTSEVGTPRTGNRVALA